MLVTAAQTGVRAYRVEISGWDSSQTFFVDHCELEWSEKSGKLVTTWRSLRPGTMVFVRLLHPTSAEQPFPVAYRIEPVGLNNKDRANRFRLTQVDPRASLDRLPHL